MVVLYPYMHIWAQIVALSLTCLMALMKSLILSDLQLFHIKWNHNICTSKICEDQIDNSKELK